jgi:hypothetical protein
MAFSLYCLAAFICDSAPPTGLGRVFDPFHRGEVVIIFLHGDDPVNIIEGDGFESEVCGEIKLVYILRNGDLGYV